MSKEQLEGSIKAASVVCLMLSIIIFLRLFHLCIIEGQTYRMLAENNRQKVIPIEPQRGIIYDRKGVPLVKNMPYFVAVLSPDDYNESEIYEISKLLGVSVDEIKEKLKDKEFQIEPVVIKEGLSFEEVARIEARHSDFPNLSITTTSIRRYLYGSVGSHLIGYLGRVTEEQLKTLKAEGIPPDAFIGQWGVERIYDKILRGIYGKKIVEVDALGHELRVLKEVPPQRGHDITLTIDIEVQKAMEEAYKDRAGAFVVLKPDTGEVLALGSLPSFDPNKFSRGAPPGYWKELSEDPRHPLLNRAFQSQYPPGSVFKIVTAIAGLEEGIIKPSTTVHCSGGIPFGNRFFRCWKKEGHGTVDLKRAIIESCDVYFYEVGKKVGIDKIAKYASLLGLGRDSGLNFVREKKGVVPSSEWKLQVTGQPWYPGETLSASIGQGYVSVTPVQLARLIAAIANGGYMPNLQILKSKDIEQKQEISVGSNSNESLNKEPVRELSSSVAVEDRVNISEGTLKFIREALRGVVNEPGGTGGAARLQDISVGGKTGTAQVISKAIDTHKLQGRFRDHAWFVAFAPTSNAEVAMSVFVEHGGHGGAAAAPIARIGLERYFKQEHMQPTDTGVKSAELNNANQGD